MRRPYTGFAPISDALPPGLREEEGWSTLRSGMGTVHKRAASLGISTPPDVLEKQISDAFEKGAKVCESPIERLALASLITGRWPGLKTLVPLVHTGDRFPDGSDIVIWPQCVLPPYRIDILVITLGRVFSAIECDGREFHMDKARDATRDDIVLNRHKVKTYRVTGAELFNMSHAYINEIVEDICQRGASR